MNLLKEIAQNKLVIMVTHNPELAQQYSTRIIQLKDGKIIGDTNPYNEAEESNKEGAKKSNKKVKTSMGLFTALSLSLNNLLTKKGRTLLTAIAGSIGIIGIALILALSNGVRNYINEMEKETLTDQPIAIEKSTMNLGSIFSEALNSSNAEKTKGNENKITINDDISSDNSSDITASIMKENNLNKFKNYLDKEDTAIKENALAIEYGYNASIQVYAKENNSVIKVHPVSNNDSSAEITTDSKNNSKLKNIFEKVNTNKEMFENQYEIISGKMPSAYNEIILIADKEGIVPLSTMYTLGIENRNELVDTLKKVANGEKQEKKQKTYDYNELVGKNYKLILNSDFYVNENGKWIDKTNDVEYLNKLYENGYDLKIVGIAKVKKESQTSGFVGYTNDLVKFIGEKNNESEIGKEQFTNKNTNVLTRENFDNINYTYESNLIKLGLIDFENPEYINIYPKSFESKNNIKKAIEEYNSKVEESDKIKYSDMMEVLISQVTNIVNIIAGVLIAVVAISLVVSGIMISIITYISVLERTKEIGILRAIGASKKDVKRVFKAETIIEGFISGVLGVGVAFILCCIANVILNSMFKISNAAALPLVGAIALIVISMLLTVIAGVIPAGMASKKDPVESLRSE